MAHENAELLLQRIQIQFLTLTWWVTLTLVPGDLILFWSPHGHGTHMLMQGNIHAHTCFKSLKKTALGLRGCLAESLAKTVPFVFKCGAFFLA